MPVTLKNELVGTLYMRSDYHRTFLKLLGFYGAVVLGITLVSIALAVFLSTRLGKIITGPILELARTTQIVGEMKDYSVRAKVESGTDELGQLASSFNDMLSRVQTQDAALSFSQQKMEALINSIDGIVWERSPNTFEFTYLSRQCETILGFSSAAWLKQSNFWEQRIHPQDKAKVISYNKEMAERGTPFTQEFRIVCDENKTVWIRESGTVLMDNGRPVTMRGIFQDITKQKLDAEQLDKLNRQLIDTSRSAGMADVATGVLHNVGNVLNSVSVSATLVSDRIRKLQVSKLAKVSEMMQKQNSHLGEFLTSDPKGKLIPEYLGVVATEMSAEQNELVSKMSSLGQHIEHIKEIVAMQQSYAKVSGVFEQLSAVDLLEDALRINATAFDRHNIDLVREIEPNCPTVSVDRHKVLQILINLLRNAKHAMDETNEQDKRLIVKVGTRMPGTVSISIIDNGIGIPLENVTKIFNHGFTTKKDGHGFGLHSGANAAKEMGGNLLATSEGVGAGAEFTLTLPVSQEVRTLVAV